MIPRSCKLPLCPAAWSKRYGVVEELGTEPCHFLHPKGMEWRPQGPGGEPGTDAARLGLLCCYRKTLLAPAWGPKFRQE